MMPHKPSIGWGEAANADVVPAESKENGLRTPGLPSSVTSSLRRISTKDSAHTFNDSARGPNDVFYMLQEERACAAKRHQELLSILSQQHRQLQRQISPQCQGTSQILKDDVEITSDSMGINDCHSASSSDFVPLPPEAPAPDLSLEEPSTDEVVQDDCQPSLCIEGRDPSKESPSSRDFDAVQPRSGGSFKQAASISSSNQKGMLKKCATSGALDQMMSFSGQVSSRTSQVQPSSQGAPVVVGRLSQQLTSQFGRPTHVAGGTSARELATSIIMHEKFEIVIAALIFANAFIMCFEVQYRGLDLGFEMQYKGCHATASAVWPNAQRVFAVFDWIFGVLFCGEMLVKWFCFSYKYFLDPWNWVDFVVVVAFLLDKAASSLKMPLDKEIISLIRLFRLVKLVRLLRTLEGLDALYVMTTAIKGMAGILGFAVLLLSVMLMTVALFLTQTLHATHFAAPLGNKSAAEMEKMRELYEYFGSFTRCLLSMFEITLANWPPVTRLLSEEVSEYFMVLCVIHKLVIGFAVIGVINGVILQETFSVAQTDDMIMVRKKKRASEILRKKMTVLFDALDNSGDGLLECEEFEVIASFPEVKIWLASMDIETDDLRTLFMLLDNDGAGAISVDHLVDRIGRIKGGARSIDVLALSKRVDEVIAK